MTANAQVSLLSKQSLLPRLLPAPQALIRTSRPLTLPPTPAKVIGVHSGGLRDFVNHIAHLIHSREELPDYSVRCERITKPDPDAGVSAASWGPLAWVEVLATAMSIGLLVLSVLKSDGFALLATLLLSFLSTLIGFGSRWKIEMMKRKSKRNVPEDQIVIKYTNGSFRIIKCDEKVARELYWHPEACTYLFSDTTYRVISLFGTIILMVGVISLGNSTLPLQVAFAAAYLILNAVYWVVAALPPQWHWDLKCYKVKSERYEGGEINKSFTEALWKAIAITKSVKWVRLGQVAPVAEGWERWMDLALNASLQDVDDGNQDDKESETPREKPLPQWDPNIALTECLNPDPAAELV